MSSDDTIFAPATPAGRSAIQIIRVSGPSAAAALKRFAGGAPEARRAKLATITDSEGARLDRGLVLFFPGPNTATGEDLAEFHLHGGPVPGRALMRALGSLPRARLAAPGEFTRRAFINGRIDLDQAEAIGDIIDADTAAQHRQAMRQLDGGLGRSTEDWRARLVDLTARLEALIDFADEELPAALEAEIGQGVDTLRKEMRAVRDEAGRGILTRDGVTVAILGRPNSGKSTLLNRLVGDDRAIVSPEAGTTRDLVRVSLDIGGIAAHLVDTAGIRDTEGGIENEGIRRALEMADGAAVVLVLVDSQDPDPRGTLDEIIAPLGHGGSGRHEERRVIPVISKVDIRPSGRKLPDWPVISAEAGIGMEEFDVLLTGAVMEVADNSEPALLTRERHREAVSEAIDALDRAAGLSPATGPELLAEEFRRAAAALGRVTGRVDVEDVLDRIFASFCIGK